MSVLNKLTEGIRNRDLSVENAALVTKWKETGLLEGISSEQSRDGMAVLLENQAKELLREAITMSAGDVEGFAAVAFPMVRRVFGGLIANDLVSVQPMSLPSGLIFFLDFTYSSDTARRLGNPLNASIYGGGRVASQITGGVQLSGFSGADGRAELGPYSLNNGYSSPTGSATGLTVTTILSGTVGTGSTDLDKVCRHDPDLVGKVVAVATLPLSELPQVNTDNLVTVRLTNLAEESQVRRLTQYSGSAKTNLLVFAVATGSSDANAVGTALGAASTADFAITDDFISGGALGSVVGDPTWGLESNVDIPEIDIKVDSISVTAITKKLKAKWSPELGQDLNAYHNLDAEVELTSVLSEHIALEIDQEILGDLINGATAGTLYWSRKPGRFLNRETGADISNGANPPEFYGTVSEWYETLLETVNEISARIHRKVLRGGANFLVCSPEVAQILEFTAGFQASVAVDSDRGTAGTKKIGSLSKKFDVYVDPYFPRQLMLVGRKGSSFLESGYVYAPYVPLQMTPTIFGTEDFVPRKGVMTRYAKKMVRPDMYGLVIVGDMVG